MRFLCCILWLLAAVTPLRAAELYGARTHTENGLTRIVFDLSAPVEHTVFTLAGPDRVVVDLIRTRLDHALDLSPGEKDTLWRMRSAPRNANDLRVVLDTRVPANPRSFMLAPQGDRGHRLVVELHPGESGRPTQPLKSAVEVIPRAVIVAIDPGHGGKDPGAIGARGSREKRITLSIARRLSALIRNEPGMHPVMIRDRDTFISLRGRIKKARAHKADLFVSIHADAFRKKSARGASVYALSGRGASSEAARWLAERENAADLVGGVSLGDKDDQLARVLLDLSQTATMNASQEVAEKVVSSVGKVTRLHSSKVGRAGFLVLKSPDIPSILVETGFLSSPSEERLLNNAAHQHKLARSILNGIRAYFTDNPPPGTLLAMREHVIKRGDTLSDIAHKYTVSLAELRAVNDLDDDLLRIGQVLRIPVTDLGG
jgi:N-acetylmuramoyl-L-alanine amidase